MSTAPPDLVFLSYSHRDPGAYEAVRPHLHDQLAEHLWDDQDLRAGDVWDERIRAAIDRSAVAVLVLGDGYFRHMPPGRNHILEQELPYLLERHRLGLLELLPIYWSPSHHFKPERPTEAEPFRYRRDGREHAFDLHRIQAQGWRGCLEQARRGPRRDALQSFAFLAKETLAARTRDRPPEPSPSALQGREPLTIVLSGDLERPHRTFQVGARVLLTATPPGAPAAIGLRRYADQNPPIDKYYSDEVGKALYRQLFGTPDGDLFARVAAAAGWGLLPGATAPTLPVAAEVRVAPEIADPWPLRLPWHLTAAGPDRLVERGWTFEAVPSGLSPGPGRDLGRDHQGRKREPGLLVLIDRDLEGARAHADHKLRLTQECLGRGVECLLCADLDQVRAQLAGGARPEVLYVYHGTGLDLEALAAALGDGVALVILNLIGAVPPAPPAALVARRKVLVAVHADHEAHQARGAGSTLLRGILDDRGALGYQRLAYQAFKERVRLWSGCAGLGLGPGAAAGEFSRTLIKVLLDRREARGLVAQEAAKALLDERRVLGLVVTGTPKNQPELFPDQVWEHYQRHRESDHPTDLRPFLLDPGPIPCADELRLRFEAHLDPPATDWSAWLDREAAAMGERDRLILSLQWHLGPCPADRDDPAAWQAECIDAWLALGLRLAEHPHPRVLLTQFLIVTAADPEAARAWSAAAQAAWRRERRANPAAAQRYVPCDLEPLSQVPPADLRYFLDSYYGFAQRHPRLDPHEVADWVQAQTGGVFSDTVALVERLDDTGFEAAYAALTPENPPETP